MFLFSKKVIDLFHFFNLSIHFEPNFEVSSEGLVKIPISAGTKLPGAEELFAQPILATNNPKLKKWWDRNTKMGPEISYIKELKRRGKTIKFVLPLEGDGKF